MATLVKDRAFVEKKEIDWVSPHSDVNITLDDYCNEMYVAERSGDITHEQFQVNMQQWLMKNL